MTFKLRDYQLRAVEETMKGFETYDRQCVVLGMGGGKTEIFIETARRYLDNNPGKAVLVLSHLSILTTQTLERFHKRAPDIRTGVLQANVRPYVLSDVVIGTMQSSRVKHKTDYIKRWFPKDIGLIIVDEAHFITTESYQTILGYYPEAKVLGMTATPFKSNQLMTHYFENIPICLSIHDLIDMGHLVKPQIWQVHRESNDIENVIGQVIGLYKTHERGKRAIVYMRTKADCRALREVFEIHGVKAEVIVDDITGADRARYIRDFSRGHTTVLISVDVLTAGFDCPAVETIFMPYEVGSTTTFLQRVGRGLRTCDEIGKDFCTVYVFGDTPGLASGFYKKAANLALNHQGKIREYDTITETVELNNWEEFEWQERGVYTQDVVAAMKFLKKSGYSALAGKINRRELPVSITLNVKEYLKNFNNIPKPPRSVGKPPTPKQRDIAIRNGIDLQGLDKADLHVIIGSILGWKSGPHVLREGDYKGNHVSVTPHAYRRAVLRSFPDSITALQIRSWNQRRGIA